MKADIDRIMAERDLDALVIFIGEEYSAALDYLVGRVRLTGGLAVKKRDVDPVLVVGGMETAEAAVSGLQVLAYSHYKLHELLEQNDNNGSYAYAAMLAAALAEQGVPAGKVGIYGTVEVNTVLDVLNRLRQAGYWVFGADMAGTPVGRVEVPERWALCLGAEERGLRAKTRSAVDEWVAVPMAAGVESLNVSVTTGVLLYAMTTATRAGG